MKASKNKVELSGRAGSDLKITNLKEKGKKVGRVSIATTSFYKDRQNQLKENTSWFNLVFWNEKADEAKKLIKKGKLLTIEGELTSQSYKDKENKTRYSTDIVVKEFTIDEVQK